MYEIVLLCYFLSFSTGAATLLLVALIYRRFGGRPFLYIAFLLFAAMLFIIGEMIQAYGSLSSRLPTETVEFTYKVCAYVGTILQLIFMPLLTMDVVGGKWRRTSFVEFILCIMLFVGLWPLEAAFGGELILDGRYAAMLIVHVSCIAYLIYGRKNIKNPEVRRVASVYAATVAIALAFSLAYRGLMFLMSLPDLVEELPVAQLIYFNVAVGITIYFGSRHFFQPARHAGAGVPSAFINDFHITHRELQIVEAILRGDTTKQLSGELCISERTVRNHVYAIYLKTLVKNRIELVNLVQSFQ